MHQQQPSIGDGSSDCGERGFLPQRPKSHFSRMLPHVLQSVSSCLSDTSCQPAYTACAGHGAAGVQRLGPRPHPRPRRVVHAAAGREALLKGGFAAGALRGALRAGGWMCEGPRLWYVRICTTVICQSVRVPCTSALQPCRTRSCTPRCTSWHLVPAASSLMCRPLAQTSLTRWAGVSRRWHTWAQPQSCSDFCCRCCCRLRLESPLCGHPLLVACPLAVIV